MSANAWLQQLTVTICARTKAFSGRAHMNSEFRELSTREKGLVEELLHAAPQVREELRTQLKHIKAEQIEDDGTLRLQCVGGTPSKYYTPVAEGICKDDDGSDIAVILHLGKERIHVNAGDHQVRRITDHQSAFS